MTTRTAEPDRKDAILRGAVSALSRNGLPALSYDTIAREAGMSRQLVRYHFRDPEALMLSICDHLGAVYHEAILRSVMQIEGRDRLKTFLDFFFDLLDHEPKPRDDRVYDALMSMSAGSHRIRRTLRQHYTTLGDLISRELQAAHPALEPQNARELSYLVVSLMYGHWKMVASLGLEAAHGAISRAGVERLIQSYLDNTRPALARGRVWA